MAITVLIPTTLRSFANHRSELELEGNTAGKVITIIDVREPHERAITKFLDAKVIPIGQLERRQNELDPTVDTVFVCKEGKLLVDGLKNPKSRSGKTNILLIRTGEAKRGVIGLYQTNLKNEQSRGLSVRYRGIDDKGVASYLLSLYCSAAILSDDAIAVLEDVEVGEYYDYIFPMYNIRFIALTDNVDTANSASMGMDMMPIMNVFNEWHTANTSKKERSVIEAGAKAGKYKTTSAAYGYVKGDDEFRTPVVDPYAAVVVRRIFEMRAKVMSLLQICGVLNEEKILLPSDYCCQRTGQVNKATNDHLWGIGNVRHILNNEMYLGHLCQLKTTTVSYKNHKIICKGKEDRVIIENNHEPIISQKLLDKVREYEKSVSRGNMTKSKVTVPLSGLMYCQDCGNKMCVHSGAGGNKMRTGYTCRLHSRCGKGCCSSYFIRKYIMEEIVLNDIKAMIDLTIDEDAAKQTFLAKKIRYARYSEC